LFLVFEFCEHDLGRLVDALPRPAFSLSEVKCLVKQLLEAVAYLHDRWIMHRSVCTLREQ
jgi:cyclin-dependent kinase 10